MRDERPTPDDPGWSRGATLRRQRRTGLGMTPARRLQWLEEMLDELLPLVGRARRVEGHRTPEEDHRDPA